MSRLKKISLACLGLLLAAALMAYRLLMPGALFLVRFMDRSEQADDEGAGYQVREVSIEKPGGVVRARVYDPVGNHDLTLLVIHGVHWGGYDEPRLEHFARRMAGLGHVVITPEIEDLKSYEIRPRAVDDITRSAVWALDESGLGGEGIGMMGISFAGGLCLSAASAPGIADRVRFVFSFGGHADLDRTMRYLVTGKLPGGGELAPDVYGQAVLVRMFAHELVPAEEVEQLRAVLLEYLQEQFKSVRSKLEGLGEESRRFVELCLKRDSKALGRILEPLLGRHTSERVLSPVRGRPPSCPVFLLHGSVDNVIPPSETVELERWASKSTETTMLISDLIRHVELENREEGRETLLDYIEIIRFWTELLRS